MRRFNEEDEKSIKCTDFQLKVKGKKCLYNKHLAMKTYRDGVD
jgi:hypothetical protein